MPAAKTKQIPKKSPKAPMFYPEKTTGFGWRVSISIIMTFGWLIFLVIWLFFYAGNFNIYQNIAIFIV